MNRTEQLRTALAAVSPCSMQHLMELLNTNACGVAQTAKHLTGAGEAYWIEKDGERLLQLTSRASRRLKASSAATEVPATEDAPPCAEFALWNSGDLFIKRGDDEQFGLTALEVRGLVEFLAARGVLDEILPVARMHGPGRAHAVIDMTNGADHATA